MTDIASKLTIKNGKFFELFSSARENKNLSVFSVEFGARTIVSSLIIDDKKSLEKQFKTELKTPQKSGSPAMYICADFVSAKKAFDQLNSLNKNVVYLPPKDDVLLYKKSSSSDNLFLRLSAFSESLSGNADIVVTTADSLLCLYPPRERFLKGIFTLEKGKEYDITEICSRLIKSGYRRESQAEDGGRFSQRGDILDIILPSFEALRLEFFGDELESIKTFDVSSQKTISEVSEVKIYPAAEVLLDDGDIGLINEKLTQQLKVSGGSELEYKEKLNSAFSEISIILDSGYSDNSLSYIMPLLNHSSFIDFFNPSLIIFDEAKQVTDNVLMLLKEHKARYKSLLLKGEVYKDSYKQFLSEEEVFILDCQKIAFHSIMSQNRIFSPQAVFDFKSISIPDYSKNLQSLFDDINIWMGQGNTVIVYAGSDVAAENLKRAAIESETGFNTGGNGSFEILSDSLPYGAAFFDEKTVIVGTYNISSKKTTKMVKRKAKDVFSQPEVGGYVVHAIHGIGYLDSVSRLKMGDAERDYFVVSYKGGDKLYVPIENMDSLTKFVSGDEIPTLSKIGGADFSKVKERVKQSVKEMAFSLLDLYAEREKSAGHKFSDDDIFLREFIEDFPYEDTEDQARATKEVIGDLTSGKVMDRLLCGDVGYGKTEVALRAAFKVISEGYQVAFVSPTTILARQHFNTVLKRMEKFGVRAGSLTRFNTNKEIKDTLEKLANGDIDIVVGTHRVLSSDVKFKKAGLLILDEEQRFGVADKEKIKQMKININVLTLSATPIPRTLHMSMVGIRDISVLDTPPAMRISPQVYVTGYSDALIYDAVNREVGRGGQVFIVYNRVETIEKFAASIKAFLPDVKLAIAHGQMQEGNLERVIADFTDGKADVLIATTIIENGIDMPRANTMIVINADMFGLSQLYQLKGRVGRSDRLAYVYFTYDEQKTLAEDAYKRLDAITQYTDLGSGFKIAMRDLEIRGAGNILGRQQHGHIEKVGYDMYVKLLESAVKELKAGGGLDAQSGGESDAAEKSYSQNIASVSKFESEVKVNTDYNAYIPNNYIEDNEWRIRVYSRISAVDSLSEREKLIAEIKDIYGKLPDPVDNLITVALVKNLAAKIGAVSVTLKKTECSVNFNKTADIPEYAASLAGRKLEAVKSRIYFAGARGEMIRFLINASDGTSNS